MGSFFLSFIVKLEASCRVSIIMPINFDLEKIRQAHECDNYFETGLWDPRDEVSSKLALTCNFKRVYCIEIREDWVELGLSVFADEIKNGRYKLILDDSINMKKYICELECGVDNPRTIFFLDAHVDNSNIKNYTKRCPLFDELEAIASLNRKDHVILIDDLRIIKSAFPWGECSYGNIDFLEQIKRKILSINPLYKFMTLNGHIENDVLYAYV